MKRALSYILTTAGVGAFIVGLQIGDEKCIVKKALYYIWMPVRTILHWHGVRAVVGDKVYI
ncbi:MAG: hypothetical protein HFG80_05950 [Eubacterium sp.]|nr:hypothetical protein [Eubacterium sp.]